MVKDYEYRLKKKDDEISELKRKIEEMSAEFARMLKVIFIYKYRILWIRCKKEFNWHNGIMIQILRL